MGEGGGGREGTLWIDAGEASERIKRPRARGAGPLGEARKRRRRRRGDCRASERLAVRVPRSGRREDTWPGPPSEAALCDRKREHAAGSGGKKAGRGRADNTGIFGWLLTPRPCGAAISANPREAHWTLIIDWTFSGVTCCFRRKLADSERLPRQNTHHIPRSNKLPSVQQHFVVYRLANGVSAMSQPLRVHRLEDAPSAPPRAYLTLKSGAQTPGSAQVHVRTCPQRARRLRLRSEDVAVPRSQFQSRPAVP